MNRGNHLASRRSAIVALENSAIGDQSVITERGPGLAFQVRGDGVSSTSACQNSEFGSISDLAAIEVRSAMQALARSGPRARLTRDQ